MSILFSIRNNHPSIWTNPYPVFCISGINRMILSVFHVGNFAYMACKYYTQLITVSSGL